MPRDPRLLLPVRQFAKETLPEYQENSSEQKSANELEKNPQRSADHSVSGEAVDMPWDKSSFFSSQIRDAGTSIIIPQQNLKHIYIMEIFCLIVDTWKTIN